MSVNSEMWEITQKTVKDCVMLGIFWRTYLCTMPEVIDGGLPEAFQTDFRDLFNRKTNWSPDGKLSLEGVLAQQSIKDKIFRGVYHPHRREK